MAFRSDGRMGGIRDHWKAQDPGPTSGGPRLLAAAHHQEAVGGEAQREVVMEAPPTPPLEVAEANFLLEFSVILFDPPLAVATTSWRGVWRARVTSQ